MGLLRAFAGLLVLCQLLDGCGWRHRAPDELGDDLSRESLRQAVNRSLQFLARMPEERVLGEWPPELTVRDLRSTLLEFRQLLGPASGQSAGAEWLQRVAERFDFYAAPVLASDHEPLFTGYYLPVLPASLIETDQFRYPLYSVPRDGVGPDAISTLSRRDIDILGKLAGRGHEIAWLEDPVDRFFLHIQGSGLLELSDGRKLHVNFAASNERPYTSIGKVLIEAGRLERDSLSMQRIRRFLEAHPDEREGLFALNERYVFFRLSERGPFGSLGIPITPGRSIATDSGVYAPGALAFIVTEVPVVDQHERLIAWRPTKRFVMNQDTGAAIRGPGRVDLYFGSGGRAGAAAGLMNRRGQLYFLVRKQPEDAVN